MEVVVSKKDEEDMSKFNMEIRTGSRMEKAWVSFKEAAIDLADYPAMSFIFVR